MNDKIALKYDLVIFDVDGTLLDTAEGVIKSAVNAICWAGYPVPDAHVMRSFIGPPIQDSFHRLFGVEGQKLAAMTEVFRSSYSTDNLFLANPYEGLYETLDRLSAYSVRIAIATYKREDYALKIIHHFGFDRYSLSSHGADPWNKLKKTDIIEICIRESGISNRSRIVMVGDTVHDAFGAKQSGIDFLGVTWGYGFSSVDACMAAGAIGGIDRPSDLFKYLLEDRV